MSEPVSGIVLAGGKSRRLGGQVDKAFLRFSDGTTLIGRVLDTLGPLCDDIVIVTNSPEKYEDLPVKVTLDQIPGGGALGGLYSGLLAAKHTHSLALACDMPVLNRPFLNHMLSVPRDYDALVPRFDSYFEPLHSVYSRNCIAVMKSLLDEGDMRIIGILEPERGLRIRYVEQEEINRYDPEHWSFFNINTPQDLERAYSALGG